jgi:hypothetical protein
MGTIILEVLSASIFMAAGFSKGGHTTQPDYLFLPQVGRLCSKNTKADEIGSHVMEPG